MLPDQKVTVKLGSKNINWYKYKGYETTNKKEIEVNVKDLIHGSKAIVEVICDYCNQPHYKTYVSYERGHTYNDTDACEKCKHIKRAESVVLKNRDREWDKIVDACVEKDYELLSSKDEYIGLNNTKIFYKCKKHGEKNSLACNIIYGHGCDECARELTSNIQKNSIDKIIETIESINNNKLLNPEDYISSHEKNLKVLCGCCNKNIFTVSYVNYKNGTNRCLDCSRSMSKNEKRIKDFLSSQNINFIQEKTFKDCKDKKVLPFDFYLPYYNLCIEFDGEQHFNSHYYETIFKENGLNYFKKTQEHDNIKTEYCKKNNINLLRIKYTNESHIEEIIINKLNELKKLVR